jgi:hypothetical protein
MRVRLLAAAKRGELTHWDVRLRDSLPNRDGQSTVFTQMDPAAFTRHPRIKLLFVVSKATSAGYWILPNKLRLAWILLMFLMKD